MENNEQSKDKRLIMLRIAYVSLLILLLSLVWAWMGSVILFLSIFSFGIPLIFIALPIAGLMMFNLKSNKAIFWGFICSLTPFVYLLPSAGYFPLERVSDSAGHVEQVSSGLSIAILLTSVAFFVVSTMSFFYCRSAYELK